MDFRLRSLGRALVATAIAGFLALPNSVAAQNTGSVAGLVTDASSGRPLAEAQVSVPGSGLGTLTNSAGRFVLLNVPVGEVTVRVDLLGYASLERTTQVTAGGSAALDFALVADAIALSEIVVTGLGKETERRKLSTSVDVITSEEISTAPVSSVDQLLQGRVAGATVNVQSAQPGTSALINFRGVSSVFGAQTPVIYVDGVRVDNSISTAAGTGGEQSSALADLLTSDIERIEVTKGGAASTLYGSDAATGVIQIFTKKGRPGAPRVTVRGEWGLDRPELKYMFDTDLAFPDLVESGETSPTFMEDNFWKTGFGQNYYLSVDGGSDQITYNISGRVSDEDGVQPKNESTSFNVRGGLRAEVTEDFSLDFSGAYTRSEYQRLFNGTAIADPLTTFEVGDALYFSGADNLDDALDIFLQPEIPETINRFIFSGGVNWTFSEDWFFRFRTGVDYRGSQQRILEPIGFTPGEPTGQLTRWDRTFTSFSFEGAVGWNWAAQSGSYVNDIIVGFQGFRDNESIISSTGTTFALPGSEDFGEAASIGSFEINEERFLGGLYIDDSFDMWQLLTLNVGVRFDGSTAFGDEVTYETYPKGGVSYLISNQEFWDPMRGWFGDLKLRAAYGETGKPPSPFDRDRSFSAVPFRGESSPRFDNPGNPDLKPERTSTFEVGFDAAMFENRLALDFTYYWATTTDALFFVPEQPVTGLGSQLRNVGELTNNGLEFAWNLELVNAAWWAWSIGGTFNYLVTSEVTDMGGAADFFVEAQKHVTEGKPVGAWYVTTPIDTNGDGLLDGSERQYTGGQPTPTTSGSFNTYVSLGSNWSISALVDFARGHQVMDFGSVWATFNGIYRREEVEGVPFPVRYSLDGEEIGTYSQSSARSAFIYDGDWFKWRELTVRYAMSPELAGWFGADRGSVYGTVRNVWIWSKTDMIDPELNGLSGSGLVLGSESSITASAPQRWRFGVELTF